MAKNRRFKEEYESNSSVALSLALLWLFAIFILGFGALIYSCAS